MHALLVVLASAAAPSNADVVAVAVGNAHSCALHADGAISCWGANGFGQLGDGTRQKRAVPVRVAGIADAIAISADADRTCAVQRAGTVACWGQLAPTLSVERPAAIPVADVVQLAGSCMRTRSSALCLSAHSQLVELTGASDAIDIAGSASRGCIVRKSGHVACWFAPNDLRAIAGVAGAARVAVGVDQACALGKDGGVTCWAWQMRVPLPGIKVPNPSAPAKPPVQVPVRPAAVAVRGVRELVGAGARVCARTARDVRCWWSDRHVELEQAAAVRALAIGNHACAVYAARDVRCWGPGTEGQLGFGWTDGHAEPIVVPGIRDAVELAASFSPGTGSSQWTCARRRDGEAACWGNVSPHNTPGGDAQPRTVGKDVAHLVRGMVAGYIDRAGAWSNLVADGGYRYHMPRIIAAQDDCAITEDHRVLCAGEHRTSSDYYNHHDRPDGEGIAIEGIHDAVQLAIGRTHTCALASGGAVICFDSKGATTRVAGIDALAISTGEYGSCAVQRDHTVTCWGPYKTKLLPQGGVKPVAIPDLAHVEEISLGADHACARESDGTVWCWGANEHGQLGDGTQRDHHEPVQVRNLAHVVQVVAGTTHTCALLASGEVACWGDATTGQIGSYSLQNVTTPVAVAWPRDP